MKHLLILLTLTSSSLTACGGTPPPDVDATVQAAVAATVAAQPTEAPTPESPAPPTPLPEPTVAAAPTDTPVPPAPTPVPPTPTPVPVPPSATPAPGSLYTVVNVASDDVLNVRAGPGVTKPIAGAIPPYGLGVQITGAGEQVAGALWAPIQYKGIAGWVNSNYLARQVGWVDEAVAARAAEIILALKNRNLDELSRFVHPDKGVRFSPYTYVRAKPGSPEGEDLVFSSPHVRDLFADQTLYNWGWFDGTGDPIDFTFEAYFTRFVYDADFARPHVVGYNEIIGRGNTINNVVEAYPEAVTIEYHFAGFDPKFEGLDWKSLRLVLEEKEGTWYLVGIVHDEWTI